MFPLLALPLLPQELILKKLDPMDIFLFSSISRKSHLLAKHARVVVRNFYWSFTSKFTDISITGIRNGKPKTLFTLRIPTEANHRFNWQEKKVEARIDDTHLCFGCDPQDERRMALIDGTNLDTAAAEVIASRLSEILKTQAFCMKVDCCSLPRYILKITSNFKHVTAKFHERDDHNEETWEILNEISADEFAYNCFFEEFRPQLPMKHRSIIVYNTPSIVSWFTKEFLMRVECEELRSIRPNLTSEDLREFIEKWKEGMFPKLKMVFLIGGFDCNLNVGAADEKGDQVINDVGGKVGKLRSYGDYFSFDVIS